MTTPDDPNAQGWNAPQPPAEGQAPAPYAPQYGQPQQPYGQPQQPYGQQPYGQPAAYPQLGYPAANMTGKSLTFSEAVRSCLSKYATFSGRARRSEYWFFTLFTVLVVIVAEVLVAVARGLGVALLVVAVLGLIVPGIAVMVRRLHDLNKSGAWYFISLIPFGGIYLLVIFCQPGTPGPNQYGPPV